MHDRLFTLANMPIQRFGSTLVSKGEFDRYMNLLRHAHRDDNVDGVMCRSLVSVDGRGHLYDCDFNQMLDLPLALAGRRGRLSDLLADDDDIDRNPIRVTASAAPPARGQAAAALSTKRNESDDGRRGLSRHRRKPARIPHDRTSAGRGRNPRATA
jgi:hypothetical protein